MTSSDVKMWTILVESSEYTVKALERLIATASPEQRVKFKEAAALMRDAMEVLSKAVAL